MLLDLGRPERRIDGYRHAASIQGAEKSREKLAARRQHDRHRIACHEAEAAQTSGYPQSLFAQCAVTDDLLPIVCFFQVDMWPLRVMGGVPVKDLG